MGEKRRLGRMEGGGRGGRKGRKEREGKGWKEDIVQMNFQATGSKISHLMHP